MPDVSPIVIAIFNSSEDTTDMLRVAFEHEGFVVLTAFTNAIRDGKVDLERFMHLHRPRVVVYDIAPPYEQNWRLFQHLRQNAIFGGVRFVLTTTNASQLHKVAGPDVVLHEIIGKPYDLGILTKAVASAAAR